MILRFSSVRVTAGCSLRRDATSFTPARGRRQGASAIGRGVAVVVIALATLAGTPFRGVAQPYPPAEFRRDFPPELLCDRDDLPVLVGLTRAGVDSIGRSFSRHNYELIARADSLLLSGYFGDPRSNDAIVVARHFVQLRSWNAMYTISNLTELRGGIARMEGAGHFLPFIEGYYNAAMYPLRHVEVAQAGEGAFCLRYRIPGDYDEVFALGSQRVRVRTHETKNQEGKKVRVLSREWAMGDGNKLELLFERNYTGRVHRETIVDRGDRLDLVVFYDLEGLYVRKHGTHKLSAIAIWRSALEADEVPKNPRVGAAAYFPEIDIDLPWFLPDVGLQDLRDFAYPPPLIATALLEAAGLLPDWLGADDAGQFRGWDSLGPRPAVLDERFPDR